MRRMIRHLLFNTSRKAQCAQFGLQSLAMPSQVTPPRPQSSYSSWPLSQARDEIQVQGCSPYPLLMGKPATRRQARLDTNGLHGLRVKKLDCVTAKWARKEYCSPQSGNPTFQLLSSCNPVCALKCPERPGSTFTTIWPTRSSRVCRPGYHDLWD